MNAANTAPNAERHIKCHSTAQHSTAQHSTAQHSTAQHFIMSIAVQYNTVTIMHFFACFIAPHGIVLLSRLRALLECLNEHFSTATCCCFDGCQLSQRSAAIQRGISAELSFCLLWDPCYIPCYFLCYIPCHIHVTISYSLLKDCTYLHAYVGTGKYCSTEAEDYAEKPCEKEWRLY